MSEFKVGDHVITRWGDGLSHLPNKACVPEGVHTIVEVFDENKKYARLDTAGGWLYPISLMTKVEESPARIDFRDECAMRVMQADWSSNGVANPAFVPGCTDNALAKWATLYYRMADAMLEARKK